MLLRHILSERGLHKSQIYLVPITQENFLPVSWYERIWPVTGREAHGWHETMLNGSPEVETGKDFSYYVVLGGCILGTVGAFSARHYYSILEYEIGLSWLGLHPDYRGYKLTHIILEKLLEKVLPHYPKATYLVEPIPADREDQISPPFAAMGFCRVEMPCLVDDSVPWLLMLQ